VSRAPLAEKIARFTTRDGISSGFEAMRDLPATWSRAAHAVHDGCSVEPDPYLDDHVRHYRLVKLYHIMVAEYEEE